MSSTPLTEEELVAFARLHGCEFYRFPGPKSSGRWYVNPGMHENMHPIEREHDDKTNEYGFSSRKELAETYLRYYGLLPEATCDGPTTS